MIDWKKVQAELGLKGRKLAQLAGVSESMWSQVLCKKRKLSSAVEKLLILRLSIHLRTQNFEQLKQLNAQLEQSYNYFQKSYPLEGSCVTKTWEEHTK